MDTDFVPQVVQDLITARGSSRADAAEPLGIYVARELTQIAREALQKKGPQLDGFELFDMDTSLDEGAQHFVMKMYDFIGEAGFISAWGKDFPRVDFVEDEVDFRAAYIGDEYGYNYEEMAVAQYTGKPLEARRATAARDAVARKHHNIMWRGDESHGLYGVLNFPWFPRHFLANAYEDGDTSQDLLKELNAFVNSITELTKGNERPDTLILPLRAYNYLSTTPWQAGGSDTTILTHFRNNNPYITNIVPSVSVVGGDEASGRDVMVAYRRDPSVIRYVAPVVFRQLTPDVRSTETTIKCIGKAGGIVSDFPLAAAVGVLAASS